MSACHGRRAGGAATRSVALASALALFAACGGSRAPGPARPYTDPGFTAAGDYRLHYALTATTSLPAEIAGSYGIVQRRNLALLTIVITAADGSRHDANGLVARAVSLTGSHQPIALSRHDAAGGPTWLAMVGIRGGEPVTIEIKGRVADAGPEFAARFTRTFLLD